VLSEKVSIDKVERKINVHSNIYTFLSLISIILLAIFPIGIDIGDALIYFVVISGSVTTTETLALVFFGGAGASAALFNAANAQGDTLLATSLLFVGVALLVTGIGFG
jgi:uncharacterized membrane protein